MFIQITLFSTVVWVSVFLVCEESVVPTGNQPVQLGPPVLDADFDTNHLPFNMVLMYCCFWNVFGYC